MSRHVTERRSARPTGEAYAAMYQSPPDVMYVLTWESLYLLTVS
jgi:hypothetical protein